MLVVASISNPHVFQAKTSLLFSGLIATPFFILEVIHPSMCWTGVLYVLVWCVVSTGLCTGLVCCMHWTGVLYVLDWCVVNTGLVCCTHWTGVLHVLDWCVVCTGLVVVCTGLVCCMYWTGHTSPIHQPSTYTSSVQHTSLVHNTLYVLCCMYSTGMLYEGGGGGKGVGHCPCTFIKEGGWW